MIETSRSRAVLQRYLDASTARGFDSLIEGQTIQLLLSTAKSGAAQGRPVILTSFSQSLRNTLRRAGFASDAIIDQHFPQKKDGT